VNKSVLLLVAIVGLISACASVNYRQVVPGVNVLGELKITAGSGWNLAPSQATPGARPGTQTWTKDGMLLDRLVIIPAVNDGESIFKTRDKAAAPPAFRAGMLPNEIEELTESTIVKMFGEGAAAVSTENLRPWRFAEQRGVIFDVRAAVTESPDYRGMVGAFIVDKKLYMIMFIAATPYYYDKHKADAEALIQSAAMTTTTNSVAAES
jgi:hypothetical protein